MHLVDLAGSERLSLSGAEGDTRLETQQINLSLTALGESVTLCPLLSPLGAPLTTTTMIASAVLL